MSNTEQTGEKFEFSTGLTEVKKFLKNVFFTTLTGVRSVFVRVFLFGFFKITPVSPC